MKHLDFHQQQAQQQVRCKLLTHFRTRLSVLLATGALAFACDKPVMPASESLVQAVLYENADSVRLYLNKGADPNVKYKSWPVLTVAAKNEQPEKVALLLKSGADKHARVLSPLFSHGLSGLGDAITGRTPISWADIRGWTALDFAEDNTNNTPYDVQLETTQLLTYTTNDSLQNMARLFAIKNGDSETGTMLGLDMSFDDRKSKDGTAGFDFPGQPSPPGHDSSSSARAK
jgi:hypothetical protein